MCIIGDSEHITKFQFADSKFTDDVVVISPQVHVIEDKAFINNVSIRHVVIPDSVRSIGMYSFENCSSLQSVKMYCNRIAKLNAGTFANCFSLANVDMTCKKMTAIEDECFRSCYSLQKISLPNTIEHIGNSCFESCYNLKDIDIPKSLMSIGMYAFCNCINLRHFCVPLNVTELKMHTFSNCHSLRDVDMHMSNLHCIHNHCFDSCNELSNVIMPVNTSQRIEIKNYAFNKCTSLNAVNISKKTHVNHLSFANCRNFHINVI